MAITFGTPSDESSTTGTSVTFNSSLFSSKGTDDGVIVALARSDQGSDVARNYAGPTGWTKLGEAESVNGSFSTTAALFWYPPGSNPSGNQVFTNDGPADFGGGSMVIVSGTSLECALEGDADRDADGDDVLIAGYAAGDADREAYAVLGVLNSGGLTVDEGSWTNHNAFDSDYGAAYRRTTTTSSAADFDTGINESFGWAAVTAMISEGSSGQAISPTGASVTVTAGSLTVTPDQPISPTGATVTVTAGTLTVAEDQPVTPTGASVSVTAGTLTVVETQPITPTGASVSVTAGSLTVIPDQPISPTGASISISAGTLTVSGDQPVSPTGASVTVTAGTLTVAEASSYSPDRFVRRHDAARTSTSNTTAADIAYDTAVFNEISGTWASDEVTIPSGDRFLWIGDLGQVQLASTRAVGTLVPVIDGASQAPVGLASHRYLRNSGGNHGASIGFGILDVADNEAVGVRNPGAVAPTDAVGSYGTNASFGGAIQLLRLPTGDLLHLERTADAAEVGTSNINTTRPWVDSSGTWTKLTWPTEVVDEGSWFTSGGDVTLPANSKFLVVWTAVHYSTDASRHTYVTALNIGGTRRQTATGYQRNTASQGPPHGGIYLHETGGSTETLYLEATHEIEGGDAGTPQFAEGALQIIELPSSAEWIHVDNGTTDSLTSALAGTTTWYDTPLSSTLRADGDSNLSLDAANDAVQNDAGETLPILAVGWQRWDRDVGTSGTRKMPWSRWDNGGTTVGYGIGGAFSRGQQSTDDCWQAHFVAAALLDLADGADLSFQVNDPASSTAANMGIFASTSRHFLGVQVLNLDSLVSSTPPLAISPAGASVSVTPGTLTVVEEQQVSPTGASISVSAGTVTVVEDQAVTPVGASVALTAGTLTVGAATPISPIGVAISVTPGMLAFGLAITPAGAAVSVTAGTLTVAEDQSVAPVGAAVTVTAGTTTVVQSQPITPVGASLTVTPGTVAVVEDQPIAPTGATVTLTAGTLTVFEDQQIDPTGVSLTVTAGAVTVDTGIPISPVGAAVSVTAGTLDVVADQQIDPAGASVSVTAGTLTITQGLTVNPDGAAVSVTAGTLTVAEDQQITPTGASVSVTAGTVTVVADQPITPTGASVTVAAGTVSLDLAIVPTGATVGVAPGVVTFELEQPISLNGATISVTAGLLALSGFTGRILTALSLTPTMAPVSLRDANRAVTAASNEADTLEQTARPVSLAATAESEELNR